MLQNSRPARSYSLISYSEDRVDHLEGKFDQISKKMDTIISGAENLTVSSTQSQKGKQLREHFSKIGNSKNKKIQT